MPSRTNKQPVRRSSRTPRCSENGGSSSRKRKNTASVEEQAQLQKKIRKGSEKIVDKYCWVCHNLGQEVSCSTCPRSFHSCCIKKGSLSLNDSGSCAECQSKSVYGKNEVFGVGEFLLKKVLEYSIEEAFEKLFGRNRTQSDENRKWTEFFKDWEKHRDDSRLCHVIDIKILIDNLNDREYLSTLSTAKFLSEIKWIYHNCCILCGSDSEAAEKALKLERKFKQELIDIEACAECYANKHGSDFELADFFTKVCKEPHEIVWAKLRGSPFWPAKCLKIYNGHADVRFFGTHDKSVLLLNQCYKISQASPNGREIKQHKYLDALNELAVYINNYQRRFFTFPYSPIRTPLLDSKSKKSGRHSRKTSKHRTTSGSSNAVEPESNDLPPDEICSKVDISKVQNLIDPVPVLTTVESSGSDTVLHMPPEGEHASSSVAVCMTFTTDDENPNEVDDCDQLINASQSVPEPEFVLPSQSELFTNGVLNVPKFLESFSHILQGRWQNFISAHYPNLLSTLTSALAQHVNSETQYQNIYVMNANSMAESLESADCNVNCTESTDFDSGDNDIEIINEIRGNSGLGKTISNSDLLTPFFEILKHNSPHVKKQHEEWDRFGKRTIVKNFLNQLKYDPNFRVFLDLANHLQKSTLVSNEEVKELKKVIERCEEEKRKLKVENQTLLIQNQNIKDIIDERAANTTVILDALRNKYGNCSLHESEMLAQEKAKYLLVEHEKFKKQMEEKLERCMDTIKELQEKNAELDALNKCGSNGVSTGSQTDLSDVPGRRMYTFREMNDMIEMETDNLKRRHEAKINMDNCQDRVLEYEEQQIIIDQEITDHTIIQGVVSNMQGNMLPNLTPAFVVNTIPGPNSSSMFSSPVSMPKSFVGPNQFAGVAPPSRFKHMQSKANRKKRIVK